jgi:hypothetical protein
MSKEIKNEIVRRPPNSLLNHYRRVLPKYGVRPKMAINPPQNVAPSVQVADVNTGFFCVLTREKAHRFNLALGF